VGTTKGERRRRELVAAAAELLRLGGFDAIRHRAVAERAGLPLASTTYYFASLDDLVTAATERTSRDELDEGRAQLDRLADPAAGADPTAAGELVELVLDLLLGPGVARRRPGRGAAALRAAGRRGPAAVPGAVDA
jgi:AcrR family transcriptional regulator